MNDEIIKQAKRVFFNSTNGQPTPKGWMPIEAWSDGRRVVVIGTPHNEDELPEDEWHNCDEMGCPSIGGHIVGIFELPKLITLPTRGNWLEEAVSP